MSGRTDSRPLLQRWTPLDHRARADATVAQPKGGILHESENNVGPATPPAKGSTNRWAFDQAKIK
jgi:hypothetical protein